ncbi:MAG: phosphate ABC transporter, permease protein PstA, partial [Leptolyngbyaceae bacterium]|nr:phosphate ABC transporter, permease protein PstA [Leptolyngbyaceae bacterium]
MDVNESTEQGEQSPVFVQNLTRRYRLDSLFEMATWGAMAMAIAVLAWLVISILLDGLGTLDWQFITSFPSRKAEQAGVLPALQGTVLLMLFVAAVSFPLGVGAAVYLEEFASDNWFT